MILIFYHINFVDLEVGHRINCIDPGEGGFTKKSCYLRSQSLFLFPFRFVRKLTASVK